MKKEEIKKLVKIFSQNFKRKDIIMSFTGSLKMYFKMSNLKFLITSENIVLTDGKNKEIQIEHYWVNNIEVQEKKLFFDMEGSYRICIELA